MDVVSANFQGEVNDKVLGVKSGKVSGIRFGGFVKGCEDYNDILGV